MPARKPEVIERTIHERSTAGQTVVRLRPLSGECRERDVDLLLMEEFHASDAFVSWFCAKLGLPEVRGDWSMA